jgi:hypothetical protein
MRPLDQLHDGGTTPQGEIHLELLRSLVADDALNLALLLFGEETTLAGTAAASRRFGGGQATFLVAIDDASNRRVGQPNQLNNAHHTHAFTVQPHNLLSPLVKLIQCLKSCVFFVHPHQAASQHISSNLFVPDQ